MNPFVGTLNSYSRELFKKHVVAPFVLNDEGKRMVAHANKELSHSYVVAHDFPRPSASFDLLFSYLQRGGAKHFARAIDVCCGTGYLAMELVRRNIVDKCIALDINARAIAQLEEKLSREPNPRIETVHGNFLEVELAEKVDLIIGNSFLHHFPDNKDFLIKCHSLLKEEGILFLCHEPTLANDFLENPIAFALAKLGKRSRFAMTDIWQYSEAGMTKLLKDSGFRKVEIEGYSFLSSLFNWLALTVWGRALRRPMPPSAWQFFFRIMNIEKRILFWLPKDWFASFIVKAYR